MKLPNAILTISMILPLSAAQLATKKPKVLSTLILLPLTGDEPRTGLACRLASDIVLDEINARADILPGYHIEPLYRDEAGGSLQSPRQIAAFRNSFLNNPNSTSYYHQSPLMMGPFFSGGCKASAGFLHHLDLVTLSEGCSAPVPPANRRLYPNLYRSRITGETVAYPQLHFLKHVGGWRRFGILTNANNVFDYTLATHLLKEAERNGFEVSYFDCVPDVDDNVMRSLKDSDTRVIVLDFTVPPLILKFICQTFKFGMTGGRYSFILFYGSYFEPPAMSPSGTAGCTREQIFQQLRHAFWIAWSSFTADPSIKSTLGHSLSDFEERFDVLTNFTRPADYDKRVLCYDATLSAAMALHGAELRLNRQNSTLSDYRSKPTEVMKVVNESIAQVDFNGLRIGRFQYSRQRAELEYDSYVAVQWTPEFGRVVLTWFDLNTTNNQSIYNLSSYSTRILNPPIWFSPNAKPPRDRKNVVNKMTAIPAEFFYSVVAIATFCGLFQSILAVELLKDCRRKRNYGFAVSMLTFSCVVFNATAVTFALDISSSPAVCYLQRAFLASAFALGQSSCLSSLIYHRINYSRRRKMLGYYNLQMQSVHQGAGRPRFAGTVTAIRGGLKRNSSVRGFQARSSSYSGYSFSSGSSELKPRHLLRLFKIFSLLMGCLTFIYLFIWFAVEQPQTVKVELEKVSYDYESDTLAENEAFACSSGNNAAWSLGLAAFHVVMLAAGVYWAYDLRNCNSGVADDFMSDYKATTLKFAEHLPIYRLCVFNNSTLFLGGTLLVVVLRSPVDQSITLAILSLLISFVNGLIIVLKIKTTATVAPQLHQSDSGVIDVNLN